MALPGFSWLFLAPPGCSWVLLWPPPGFLLGSSPAPACSSLATPGSSWLLLAPLGSSQAPEGEARNFWFLLAKTLQAPAWLLSQVLGQSFTRSPAEGSRMEPPEQLRSSFFSTGDQEQPGRARRSQEEPGRARRSQGEPGGARKSQEEPGKDSKSQWGGSAPPYTPGSRGRFAPPSGQSSITGRLFLASVSFPPVSATTGLLRRTFPYVLST